MQTIKIISQFKHLMKESNKLPKFSQRARKFKKVQAKKLVKSNKSKKFFREISFLVVLTFSPVQKLIFGLFKMARNGFWQRKKFVKLIY